MSRKQIFANLSTPPQKQPEEPGHADSAAPMRRPPRFRPLLGSPDLNETTGRTPVGALGQSLGEANERSKRADEIEAKLRAGQTVVELDTDDIQPSFVPDRMPTDDEAFKGFVNSIREEGQQTPILVRPHPEMPRKYQVAFGHRRLRAASALGRPVRAVVREMTDQELVVAQGQENNERQDLSYIEKVRFAQRLAERHFSRDIIMSALAVYKSDLSNMLAVAGKIPSELIEKIGPAHGVGRRNWMALADKLDGDNRLAAKALELANTTKFAALPSKERFDAVAREMKEGPLTRATDVSISRNGAEIGRVSSSKHKVTLTVDRKASPEFAEFVLEHIPRLYDEYRKAKS